MALPDSIKASVGTQLQVRNSGGDAAITFASLANNAARQAVKLDLGALRARLYRLVLDCELAATPTAGAEIECYGGWSNSGTAGTDNPAGLTGADAAYTGQSSNLDASVRQLSFLGSAVVSALATATVQRIEIGVIAPPARYLCLVVYNKSGVAFHSTETNQTFRMLPILETIED